MGGLVGPLLYGTACVCLGACIWYGNFFNFKGTVRLSLCQNVLNFKNIGEKAKIIKFSLKCQYLQNLRNIIVEKKHGQNHIYLLKIWEEILLITQPGNSTYSKILYFYLYIRFVNIIIYF